MCRSWILEKRGQEMPALPSRSFGTEGEADKGPSPLPRVLSSVAGHC